jgi:hypothetical protein
VAIALVRAGTIVTGTTQPTFGQATAAGNLLVALINFANTSSGISNGVSGWTQAVQNTNGNGFIWYKQNSAASETAPQFSGFNSVATASVLLEFSGADTASPLDQTGTGYSLVTSITSLAATCSAADASSGSLIVSVDYPAATKATTITTSDAFNNGATAVAIGNNDATSTQSQHYRMSYGITTGTSAPDSNTMSLTNMNISSNAVTIASFKPAGSGSIYTKTGNGREGV